MTRGSGGSGDGGWGLLATWLVCEGLRLKCNTLTIYKDWNDVKLPDYTPKANRSGKSLQLWIARRQPLLES